jgi:hypothetical protein
MRSTDYHAKYCAHELTKRCPSDNGKLKANAVQIFKVRNRDKESAIVFRTV